MQFVDTNVLLYAALPDPEEADKQRIAELLLERDDLALSTQVLQEFYHQATRPNRPHPLSAQEALAFLAPLTHRFLVLPVTVELFHQAAEICQRFGISYWDAAILAAARTMACDAVYSEDLSDQQDYAGLQVINPFSAVSS
ncbi:MAG: PIN domain-containing protein [Chloroflexota bacterium]|nr:PIN domain-containing protein [Chloroflexota bacterium]MDE2896149.1 PIN domain-containing protein [Chloroflexota bacterium]